MAGGAMPSQDKERAQEQEERAQEEQEQFNRDFGVKDEDQPGYQAPPDKQRCPCGGGDHDPPVRSHGSGLLRRFVKEREGGLAVWIRVREGEAAPREGQQFKCEHNAVLVAGTTRPRVRRGGRVAPPACPRVREEASKGRRCVWVERWGSRAQVESSRRVGGLSTLT